jgi:hypothetical protein
MNKWIRGYFKFNIMDQELEYKDELVVKFTVSVEKKLEDPDNKYFLVKQFDIPGYEPSMRKIQK